MGSNCCSTRQVTNSTSTSTMPPGSKDKNKSHELEETLKRLGQHAGVLGTIVVNSDGIAVKTTMDAAQTVQYTALISGLTKQARAMVRNIDPGNELNFVRIRSKKNEILIAPDRDYILIVVQTPAEDMATKDAAPGN